MSAISPFLKYESVQKECVARYGAFAAAAYVPQSLSLSSVSPTSVCGRNRDASKRRCAGLLWGVASVDGTAFFSEPSRVDCKGLVRKPFWPWAAEVRTMAGGGG